MDKDPYAPLRSNTPDKSSGLRNKSVRDLVSSRVMNSQNNPATQQLYSPRDFD